MVLDELHRTGAKEWGDRLNTLIDNQPESTKVLGITATPRRDADGINMANEVAQRLGYTNTEAVSGKHIAMNMSLTNAIRMALVVNPKLVSCAYTLKTDGSLDRLQDKIEQIENIEEKNEKLEEYESLRRNLENAEGIPPTKEQVEELRNLGVDLEVEVKNITEEFIEELIQLQNIGINISKIITTDTIETLAKKSNIDLKMLKDKCKEIQKSQIFKGIRLLITIYREEVIKPSNKRQKNLRIVF